MNDSCKTFYRRNRFPKIEKEWEKTPKEGERVEVDYGTSTNSNVWYRRGKFRNNNGFELCNIIGWRPIR